MSSKFSKIGCDFGTISTLGSAVSPLVKAFRAGFGDGGGACFGRLDEAKMLLEDEVVPENGWTAEVSIAANMLLVPDVFSSNRDCATEVSFGAKRLLVGTLLDVAAPDADCSIEDGVCCGAWGTKLGTLCCCGAEELLVVGEEILENKLPFSWP